MKKTLATFGDSFCDPFGGHVDKPELDNKIWCLNIPGYECTTFGQGGSSLFWSYDNFIKYHANYDRIVFVATDAARSPVGTFIIDGKTHFCNSYMAAVRSLKIYEKTLNNTARTRLLALKDYYQHLQDNNVDLKLSNLMLKDVKLIRPDALIIHTNKFPNYNDDNICFADFWELFLKSIDLGKWQELKKIGFVNYEIATVAHMSVEMNLLVAEYVSQALISGRWIDKLPDYVEHTEKFEDYYDVNLNFIELEQTTTFEPRENTRAVKVPITSAKEYPLAPLLPRDPAEFKFLQQMNNNISNNIPY